MSEKMTSVRLKAIRHLHRQGEMPGGGTSGFCTECSWAWPCETFHWAAYGDPSECRGNRWCEHEQVAITDTDPIEEENE